MPIKKGQRKTMELGRLNTFPRSAIARLFYMYHVHVAPGLLHGPGEAVDDSWGQGGRMSAENFHHFLVCIPLVDEQWLLQFAGQLHLNEMCFCFNWQQKDWI
jgi:hypothetical protein